MTRVVSVGRSTSLLAAGALGFAFLTITLTGCPGTLDPTLFANAGTAGTSGTAGTGPGTAGTGSGTGGTTNAGTGGATLGCDVGPLFIGKDSKYKCSETGICHDATGGGAAFSMATADWQSRLVGVVPKGGGTVASICAKDNAFKNVPYIIKGSATGDGLLMQKLKGAICAPGGVQMPLTGGPMTPAEIMCAQQWATALAAMP
jgi:hypothetical protein